MKIASMRSDLSSSSLKNHNPAELLDLHKNTHREVEEQNIYEIPIDPKFVPFFDKLQSHNMATKVTTSVKDVKVKTKAFKNSKPTAIQNHFQPSPRQVRDHAVKQRLKYYM